MRWIAIVIFVSAAFVLAGCEECETSRDCDPGNVCIDSVCEKQYTDCDGGPFFGNGSGTFHTPSCGDGEGNTSSG